MSVTFNELKEMLTPIDYCSFDVQGSISSNHPEPEDAFLTLRSILCEKDHAISRVRLNDFLFSLKHNDAITNKDMLVSLLFSHRPDFKEWMERQERYCRDSMYYMDWLRNYRAYSRGVFPARTSEAMAQAGSKLLELHAADLSKLWLPNLQGGSRNYVDANMSDSVFRSSFFDRAILQDVRLQRSILSECDFRHAAMLRAEMDEACCGGANFYSASAKDSSWVGTNLTRADFSNAVLDGANLTNANVQGAKFDMTSLWGANLTGVDIGKASCFRRVSYDDKTVWPEGFDPKQYNCRYNY